MREGWEVKKLTQLADVSTGKWDANHAEDNGEYRFYTCAFKYSLCNTKRFSGESLILPGNGVNVGEVFYYNGEFDAYQRTYVINSIKIFPKYLYYHLLLRWKEIGVKSQFGSATNFIKIGNFHDYDVEYPISPNEQKRIVTLLDEAFAVIDKAKTNLQQNLQASKELFESYLQNIFAEKGEGWEKVKLSKVCSFEKTTNKRNDLPYVGLEDIESNTGRFLGSKKPQSVKSSTFYFTKDHLLYGRLRPYLNKVLSPDFEGHCSTEIFPIRMANNLEKRFLFYWLTCSETVKKIDATWTGARMPRANMNAVLEFDFSLPSLTEQIKISNTLEALSSQTQTLQTHYQQKLQALAELKKSILQKAFAGELTATQQIKQPASIFTKVAGISTTDLQASIIAFALKKHQGKETASTFGNVKAEKIINTVQYLLNIDLERSPYKDAAGPNDFARLKFVQSRAAKAGIFSVSKQGEGNRYYIGRQADGFIEKAKAALGERWNKLEILIDLFVPMDTERAEVVATVYAAWNNLLLDDKTITDEAIVTEARENWHPAKKKIERDKFFKSIDWLRKKDLIPKGSGQKVEPKSA